VRADAVRTPAAVGPHRRVPRTSRGSPMPPTNG
jgi:hypothetical protein